MKLGLMQSDSGPTPISTRRIDERGGSGETAPKPDLQG
jgi:hypothetical protein